MWALILAVALTQPPVGADAAPAARLLAHYTHQRWSEESDAPRPVFAMAQDMRGYIWVAAATGLFRFDGIRFEHVSAGVDLVSHGAPSALLVRRNGDVWTSFERSGRFAVYRDGRLRFLRAPPSPDRVMAMHEARDGTIWVLSEGVGRPLRRFRNGRWSQFGTARGAPMDNPFSMVVTRDGAVWVSFTGSVARIAPGGQRLQTMRIDASALGRLSLDPQGRIWLTERRGTYPITGPNGRGAPPPLRHPYATDAAQIRGRPLFDREGNLWVATYYDGLRRVARPDVRGAATRAEASAQVEHFTGGDGLSSNATTGLFQDAEGNVWAMTENGLDRFWPALLRFEPELTDTAAFGDLLLAASDGSVYIGQASTVYRVAPGARPQAILHSRIEPRTLCEAPDKSIWIGLGQKVLIWRGGKIGRLAQDVPVSSTIYDCAFDAQGNYWVTAARGGMLRYRSGRWDHPFGPARNDFQPSSMITGPKGEIIVQWNNATLGSFGRARRTALPLPLGGYAPEVVTLYSASTNTVLAAGYFGLARLRGDRFSAISAKRVPLFQGVTGMVHTPAGEMWLAGPGGLIRIAGAELDRAFDLSGHRPHMQVFGVGDGLRSRPHSHSRRAIVRGGDGRLWLATQTGTLWLDPADLTRSPAPPRVSIGALVADRVYRDPTGTITLPAGTTNLQIDFSVLAFSNPRAARARYRIDGQDEDWIDAGSRRQAFYTNLAPGTYRFRLTAANDSGVWHVHGTTVTFVIPPTFFQSGWFALLCGIAGLLLLWLAYRLRMAQMAGRIRNRLEERFGERARIARELHDTLLQSVQGLMLRFQSVANKLPAADANRAHLEAALQRADEIIADGRNRVQDLRVAEGSGDLPEMLKEHALAAAMAPAIAVRILIEGRARRVDPRVSVEIARIVDEALFNIVRHAQAGSVDIVVRFSARQLGVEIRDDGIGIAENILRTGQKPGHFGLVGMRERAERIGGNFSIDSSPRQGCAVTMTLPARLAFADHAPGHRRRSPWLFFNRKEPGNAP